MSSFRFIVLARSILFGAFIALILGIGAVDETRAQGPLGKILSKMDAYNKNLSSLTANVIMVKTDSFLKSSDVTKGNTAYLPETEKRPRYIIVNWTEPITEHILVIGNDYKLYSPHRKFAFEGKTDNAQGNAKVGTAFAFIGMSAEQRRANFTAEYVDLEKLKDGTPAWHLILKPMAKANFKFAYVWINTDGLPQQTRITAMNDDHTTILLTNISGNKKLDAKLFKLSYKKGTVIQKV